MSLYSEPDITEISREKRVKEAIISELSARLKNIQTTQQSRRPGEPIYTCDSSNQLCNVLEAVFLHGHKSTQGVRKSQSTENKAFDRCVGFQIITYRTGTRYLYHVYELRLISRSEKNNSLNL